MTAQPSARESAVPRAGSPNIVGIITPYVNPLTNPKPATADNSVVESAAKKHGIDPQLLIGVWGLETDFGKNVKTSSAGAVGDFQFLPSTAAGWKYPLTNTPTSAQFAKQADAAAGYLAQLIKDHNGDVNAAVHAYSGGGYGLSEVQSKAKEYTGGGGSSIAGNVGGAIGDALSIPAKFYDLITDVQTWIRIGEAIAGLVLIYFGLKQLTG